MNVNNFGSLDFGNMLNRRQNEWNQTLNGVSQMGDAFNTYYDRKQAEDDRKRKWDAILDIEKKGNEALQADDNYNNSVAKQKELQGYIDTANGVNQRVDQAQTQLDKANASRHRYLHSITRGQIPEGAEDFQKDGSDGYLYNGQFYDLEGVNNGSYREDGFIPDGAWKNAPYAPYSAKMEKLMKDANPSQRINTEGLQWKLQQEQERELNYRKAGQNADMYRDPRYQVALATAKANGDPTALNQYVQQWSAEAPQRDRYKTMEAVQGLNLDLSDMGKYGSFLNDLVKSARTPQELGQYLSMVNGFKAQLEANKISKDSERGQRINDNKFALAMHDFNNKNWTLADLGNKYRDVDLTTLDPREIKYIQRILKVPPTGKVGNQTIQAMQKAVAEGDVLNEVMKKLYTEFDASKVLGSINDSNKQKKFDEYMRNNVFGESGTGW